MDNNDIVYAKLFILRRTATEDRTVKAANKIIQQLTDRIIDLSYQYQSYRENFRISGIQALNDEVDILIDDARDEILQIISLYSYMVDDGNNEAIDEYIEESNRDTLLTKYFTKYKYEMSALIAASFFIGLSKAEFSRHYKLYGMYPFKSPVYQQAKKLTVNRSTGINIGVDKGVPATTSLLKVARGEVTLGWMYWQLDDMAKKGAIGFMQYRGSSYPCQVCDDMVGYHPIEEFDWGYPHINCKCYRVPVYEK